MIVTTQEPETLMTATAPAPATTTAAAPAAPKKLGGFLLTAKITFGQNAEKKAYNGTDNNPKRPTSNSFKKFALYKDGMTVEDAQKAGLTGADLSWDTKHGFIVIK